MQTSSPHKRLLAHYVLFAVAALTLGGFIAFGLWITSDPPGIGSSMAGQSDDFTGYIPVALAATILIAFAPLALFLLRKHK